MKKIQHKLASLAIFISVAATPFTALYAVTPVIDANNLTQAIKQVAAWQQQYTQMQSQIVQMKASYDAMRGDRGMGKLLPENRTYLPPDWNSAMSTLNQGGNNGYSALAKAAQEIKNAQSVLTQQQTANMTPQMQQYLEKVRNLSASQQAMGQIAYNTAAKRVQTLQTLTNAINGQTDPKAIMDLQARIQAEQAGLANDQAQLQSVAQLTAAQGQAQKVMANELRSQTSGTGHFPSIDTSLPQ